MRSVASLLAVKTIVRAGSTEECNQSSVQLKCLETEVAYITSLSGLMG